MNHKHHEQENGAERLMIPDVFLESELALEDFVALLTGIHTVLLPSRR